MAGPDDEDDEDDEDDDEKDEDDENDDDDDEADEDDDEDDDESVGKQLRRGSEELDSDMYMWDGRLRESAMPVDAEGAKLEDGFFTWQGMDRFLEDMEEAQERGAAEEEEREQLRRRKQRPQTTRRPDRGDAEAQEDDDDDDDDDEEDDDELIDYFSANPTSALEARERARAGGQRWSIASPAASTKSGAERKRAKGKGDADDDTFARISMVPPVAAVPAGAAAADRRLTRDDILRDAPRFEDFFDPVPRAGKRRVAPAARDFESMAASGSRASAPAAPKRGRSRSRSEDDDNNNNDDDDDNHALQPSRRQRVRFDDVGAEAASDSGDIRDDRADNSDEEEDEEEADGDVDLEHDASVAEPRTSHERQRAALARQIQQLESEAVETYTNKPWMLRGEVAGASRPENSLLDVTLDYESATRPAPLPTASFTKSLEDLIRRRIADEAFDDPEAGKGPSIDLGETEKAPELSAKKAEKGLGEEYEAEFRARAMGEARASIHADLEKEIEREWASLARQLDGLAHFVFVPRADDLADDGDEGDEEAAGAAGGGVRVRANVPAISMEDVQPTIGSAAAAAAGGTAAPEEVHARGRGREGVLVGSRELLPEDKQARRRAKKAAKRKASRESQAAERTAARLNPGLGNRHAKEALVRELTSARNVREGEVTEAGISDYAASSRFFARLQQQAKVEADRLRDGQDGAASGDIRGAARAGKKSSLGGQAAKVKL